MNRLSVLVLLSVASSIAGAQGDTSLFREMRWRGIGPFRGGRTVAAVGVRQQPATFYMGVNNGGVWKTTDYGRVWSPIFDDQPTGSIGAIAVAPSDPNVIYVGSGEGLQRPDLSVGDGIYKSTDAGQHWQHLGLRDGQQIPAIVVDPKDPSRLFVAVMGHPYGANPERGIFRSTDGGQSFKCVLCPDENTGGMDVVLAPDDPNTVFAVLWSARQAPWEGALGTRSASNGMFKSTDGGTTWRQITRGLPGAQQELGRIGLAVAASDPRRMYAVVGAQASAAGLYRSDDAGESWRRMNGDDRLWGRDGDFNEVRADPRNADVVYVANVVAWKSTDGGASFTGWRGAPGGDDYHRLWINPDNSQVILLAGDQGAIVTVNGGETWSSWYNQSTAQMYHVAADNSFPYRLCGGQQESGSACVASRGDDGIITIREWHPVGLEEYGYAAPDPLDPNIVYGGKLTRFDWRSHDTQNIAPRAVRDSFYRVVRTMPVVFSQADPHALYYSSNVVWRTTDGGRSWARISGDLTRTRSDPPPSMGVFASLDPERGAHRGVVYSLAPSPKDARRLWAGTDDGLIHVTVNGGISWRDVTPPELRARPWSKISQLDASHFDTATVFAAVNTFRLDDTRPHIWRTTDGGRTWREIVNGIPSNDGVVNVVREDPARRGVLYAGTERQAYVSFDNGDHWQSMRLNMPATSIRDLIVKDADVAVATHGRGFWILDDVEPLRQAAGLQSAMRAGAPYLVHPPDAVRWRWNRNTDTPIPPDEPQADNPPEGAIIDYYVPRDARRVVLEIRDANGGLVRRYSSTDSVEQPIPGRNIPDYWIRPPHTIVTSPGLHRFAWDMRYALPPVPSREYPIAAVYRNTPQEPRGVWVLPGRYQVRLIVEGQTGTTTREANLTIRMDPRVTTTTAGLTRQHTLGRQLSAALERNAQALRGVRALRARLRDLRSGAGPSASWLPVVDSLEAKGAGLVGDNAGLGPAGPTRSAPANLVRLQSQLTSLLDLVEGTDAAPTTQIEAAVREQLTALDAAIARWQSLRGTDLESLNARLRAVNVKPVVPEP